MDFCERWFDAVKNDYHLPYLVKNNSLKLTGFGIKKG